MTRVLVLGATGDQGHPLITRLIKAGLTPIAALRNPDAFQGTEFAHVETVQADLYDAQSMIDAARGICRSARQQYRGRSDKKWRKENYLQHQLLRGR